MNNNVSVGVRLDGSIDIDIQDESSSTWCMSNIDLAEAEFLYEELGLAIKRQHSRGFSRPVVALVPVDPKSPA